VRACERCSSSLTGQPSPPPTIRRYAPPLSPRARYPACPPRRGWRHPGVKDQGKDPPSARFFFWTTSSARARERQVLASPLPTRLVRSARGRIEAKVNVRKGFEFSVWLRYPERRKWQLAGCWWWRTMTASGGSRNCTLKARFQHTTATATAEEGVRIWGSRLRRSPDGFSPAGHVRLRLAESGVS